MGKNMERLRRSLPILVLILIGLMSVRMCNNSGKRKIAVDNHKWAKLLLVLDQIEKHYVDSVDYKEMVEKTLPMVLQNLDPHSVYLPPQELEVAEESLEGNFSGIGVQFNVPNDTVVIINVIPGGPSERVGILSGDRIITVDGENVAGVKMNQDSIVKKLKGPKGSLVKVQLGLCKGKKLYDKRDSIKERELNRKIRLKDV